MKHTTIFLTILFATDLLASDTGDQDEGTSHSTGQSSFEASFNALRTIFNGPRARDGELPKPCIFHDSDGDSEIKIELSGENADHLKYFNNGEFKRNVRNIVVKPGDYGPRTIFLYETYPGPNTSTAPIDNDAAYSQLERLAEAAGIPLTYEEGEQMVWPAVGFRVRAHHAFTLDGLEYYRAGDQGTITKLNTNKFWIRWDRTGQTSTRTLSSHRRGFTVSEPDAETWSGKIVDLNGTTYDLTSWQWQRAPTTEAQDPWLKVRQQMDWPRVGGAMIGDVRANHEWAQPELYEFTVENIEDIPDRFKTTSGYLELGVELEAIKGDLTMVVMDNPHHLESEGAKTAYAAKHDETMVAFEKEDVVAKCLEEYAQHGHEMQLVPVNEAGEEVGGLQMMLGRARCFKKNTRCVATHPRSALPHNFVQQPRSEYFNNRLKYSVGVHSSSVIWEARVLFSFGADPNYVDTTSWSPRYGETRHAETALHQVATPEMAELLCAHGADPTILARGFDFRQVQEGNTLKTALHTAKNAAVARVLIEHGADPNYVPAGHPEGYTYVSPLEYWREIVSRGGEPQHLDAEHRAIIYSLHFADILAVLEGQ